MNAELFIFEVLGVYYLAVGAGMLLNRNYYRNMFEAFLHRPSVMFMAAVITLAVGFSMLHLTNNLETTLWAVLISFFGWMAVFKGIVLLLMPKRFSGVLGGVLKKKYFIEVTGTVAVVLGIGCLYIAVAIF